MLAYMNAASYAETLATGRAVYFSRSRGKLWRKGEESGDLAIHLRSPKARDKKCSCKAPRELLDRVRSFYRVSAGSETLSAGSRNALTWRRSSS